MWVNKYRPTDFSEIVGNTDVVMRFDAMAKTKQVQHFILCGPTGVGKSTMIDILVRRVLGSYVREGLLQFDSSDDRGIQTVREKIHQFVPKLLSGMKAPKLLVFEEAETIGEGVQQMMRRLMEKHSHHTAFIFVCTSIHGIIETLQSRCQIFRLRSITACECLPLLRRIGMSEGKKWGNSNSALLQIANLSRGDVRRCVNFLQMCCYIESDKGELHSETVCKDCLYPHYDMVRNIVVSLLNRSLRESIEHTRSLYEEGYNGVDIIMFMHDFVIDQEVMADIKITRAQHLLIVKQIGITHVRLTDGVDSFCQLCGMLSRIYMGFENGDGDDHKKTAVTITADA